MKKNLMLLVGIAVLLVVVIGVFVMKGKKAEPVDDESDEVVADLPQSQWPAMSLVPTQDPAVPKSLGHFLAMKVQKINVPKAETMDYLLVYSTSDGGQQGVPGSVKLTGDTVEKKLLLGSESSGKFRFDAGVSQGTITLTFRDGKGKSLGRIVSDFHLQSDTQELTSVDGSVKYTLDKTPKGTFFVTVKTFLEPAGVESVYWQNGYGIYASDDKEYPGKSS